MRRGRLLSGPDAQPYTPPESAGRPGEEQTPEARVQEAVRAGFSQGLARGRADGAAAYEAERQKLRAETAAALAALADARRKVLEECRGAVLDLALEIAERVVRARIEAGDPVAERIAEEVLAGQPRAGARTVRVHPDDHHALLEMAPRLGSEAALDVVPDPSVAPGGVVVETSHEIVDARIETAFTSIREALEEER